MTSSKQQGATFQQLTLLCCTSSGEILLKEFCVTFWKKNQKDERSSHEKNRNILLLFCWHDCKRPLGSDGDRYFIDPEKCRSSAVGCSADANTDALQRFHAATIIERPPSRRDTPGTRRARPHRHLLTSHQVWERLVCLCRHIVLVLAGAFENTHTCFQHGGESLFLWFK